MTRLCPWLVDRVSRALDPVEQEAVLGDLAESGESAMQALRQVLELVLRRQAALWKDCRPWAALLGLVVPLFLLLSPVSLQTADGTAVRIWLYANNWDWSFLGNKEFQRDFPATLTAISLEYARLICWSWAGGLVLGSASRRGARVNGTLFCLFLLFGDFLGSTRYFGGHSSRVYIGHAAVFDVQFYRVAFPFLVQIALVMLPTALGLRQAIRSRRSLPLAVVALATFAIQTCVWFRFLHGHAELSLKLLQLLVYWPILYWTVRAIGRRRMALLLAMTGIAAAADQPTVRAVLQPPNNRQAAQDLALKDSSGKTVTLKKYRGKVVLLDFWATWCHGCKLEIPWFVDFDRKYHSQGLAVVGVSMDDQGWKVVKPFIRTAGIPYRILLGDEPVSKQYHIDNMPDTFLIDRRGRLAATYVGVVDKADIEENIRKMLSEVPAAR